jgi:KUP system potassium uptake protein
MAGARPEATRDRELRYTVTMTTAGDPNGGSDAPSGRRLAVLCLAALGVVYGDIGTSPLYAIRECFYGEYGIPVTTDNVLGVLSLVFWALIIVVTLKYLTFILRADNNGEGGVIALMALVLSRKGRPVGPSFVLVTLGLFGASLLYGDGMITPAISVLSAIEGLHVATPFFDPYVVPATVAILIGLFMFQRRGTGHVGAVFGPITLLWFAVIAVLGISSIVRTPSVLAALSPHFGLAFIVRNGAVGYLTLGGVFLVVTGAEALYADLGHFGRRPIRVAWYTVVLPSLLANYFGQGALLLRQPQHAHNPFYNLAPAWALYPLVAIATAATIIASQAVISGAFSLTRQAMQLGYCPRMRVEHTSSEEIGQVYIPLVNWVLMVATISLVLAFRSSSTLAAAYGVAVTTTMIIATMLFFYVARERWGWSLLKAGIPTALFLVVDVSFFGANISKIAHGAWFPLAIGLVVFVLLSTWKRGREILAKRFAARTRPFEAFFEEIEAAHIHRVPGRGVFMTSDPTGVPPVLLHNLAHNKVLHEEVVLLTVVTEDIPRVPAGERVTVVNLGHGFFQLTARYGFMEDPSIPHVLGAAKAKGLDLTMAETSFFLGRETPITGRSSDMAPWRARLFRWMNRNSLGATAYFRIPPGRVVEIGAQIEV